MTESDIVDQVYRSGSFASREEATSVTTATLRALGDCLSPGQARDLAESLPRPLADCLLDAGPEPPKRPSYEEFLDEIATEADVGDRPVDRDVRAVVAVLTRRVGEDEIDNARAQLPPNYDRLFDVESATVGRPFVDLVVERGSFDPDVDARAVTRAAVETLGERLSRGEAEDLSRYLEGDAREWIVDRESPDAASFSAAEFVDRVSRRADVPEEAVRGVVQVVGDVLSDVVPSRELERAFDQLPAGFDPLFGVDE